MFADATHGWGIALKNSCEGSCALLRTNDDGRQWDAIDVNR
jgi:hypothetical protein